LIAEERGALGSPHLEDEERPFPRLGNRSTTVRSLRQAGQGARRTHQLIIRKGRIAYLTGKKARSANSPPCRKKKQKEKEGNVLRSSYLRRSSSMPTTRAEEGEEGTRNLLSEENRFPSIRKSDHGGERVESTRGLAPSSLEEREGWPRPTAFEGFLILGPHSTPSKPCFIKKIATGKR